MSAGSRTVNGRVLPERSGYYVGVRMVEPAVAAHGLAAAVRCSAREIAAAESRLAGAQTA